LRTIAGRVHECIVGIKPDFGENCALRDYAAAERFTEEGLVPYITKINLQNQAVNAGVLIPPDGQRITASDLLLDEAGFPIRKPNLLAPEEAGYVCASGGT
jgi:hypothetical protein